jgi:hypothetical protein
VCGPDGRRQAEVVFRSPYIRWNREASERPGRGTTGVPHEPSHHLNRIDPSNALELRIGREAMDIQGWGGCWVA